MVKATPEHRVASFIIAFYGISYNLAVDYKSCV